MNGGMDDGGMDGVNAPIGVFDSGLGGLTATAELRRLLPGEEIIYFGDTARCPYGSKDSKTLMRYVSQNINFLRGFHVKAILCACATASSAVLPYLSPSDIPVAGVVGATCAAAAKRTKNRRIGVIATAAAIASGAYERTLKEILPEAEVFSLSTPLLVPLIEDGRFQVGDEGSRAVLLDYLQPLMDKGMDTLILGCTHYPLMEGLIRRITGEDISLINSGREGALHLVSELSRLNLKSGGAGGIRYYVSGDSALFARNSRIFLKDGEMQVTQIDIERF